MPTTTFIQRLSAVPHRLRCSLIVLAAFALQISFAPSIQAEDWRGFRGPDGNSVAEDASPPVEISQGQIAWKLELPGRGPSSPIVVGDRVYVTCSGGAKQDRLYLLSIDAETGKEVWRRELWATGRCASHPSSANAAPTPVSDGDAIYTFYSSNDLACYELDGRLRWFRGLAFDYPKAGNDIGMASSPVIVDGVLVVQVENQGDSFAAGIDTKSGTTVWRIDRDPVASWSSPVPVVPADSTEAKAVLLQSPSGLTAVEARSGSVCGKATKLATESLLPFPSPVVFTTRPLTGWRR